MAALLPAAADRGKKARGAARARTCDGRRECGAPRGSDERDTPPGAAGVPPAVPMTGGRPPPGAAIRRRDARAVRVLWRKHVIEQYMTKKLY